MKKAVVTKCVKTSKFSNGFDVDFNLMGDSNTYHGILYEKHGEPGKYTMGVFKKEGFEKYSVEPNSEVTDNIGEQILKMLNGEGKQEVQETKEKVLYICRNDNDDLDEGLVGMMKVPEDRNLASIDDLIFKMNKQKIELLNGGHADGYLVPWEKYLVVKEGVAVWDETIEDYILAGTINEDEEITILNQSIIDNKKYVVVKEQITLYFPSSGEEDFVEYVIECGEAFEIVGEVVYHVGTESIVHYVVKISGDYTPFTIPSCKTLVAHGSHNLEKVRELIG